MIPFLASWKTWIGVAVIAAGGLSLLLPAVSAFVVAFLQTQTGRLVAVIAAGVALLWFAYAYVDANAYARGVRVEQEKQQMQSRENESTRKELEDENAGKTDDALERDLDRWLHNRP